MDKDMKGDVELVKNVEEYESISTGVGGKK
jgi:hypothetical protein